jgi:solute carrier family 40 (iron-regulated transporter), member 1
MKKIRNRKDNLTNDNKRSVRTLINKVFYGWKVYWRQGIIVMPSFGLAIIFLTVISFDSITIGYAKSQNVTELTISIFQGIGSILGILGTFAFPFFYTKLSLRLPLIGMIGFSFQFIFVVLCFIGIWLPGSPFILANNSYQNEYPCSRNESDITKNNTMYITFNKTINNQIKTADDGLNKFESTFIVSSCFDYTSILFILTPMAVSRFGIFLK